MMSELHEMQIEIIFKFFLFEIKSTIFFISDMEISLLDLIIESNVVKSRGEAKRLIEQGGVEIDGVKRTRFDEVFAIAEPFNLRVGKKSFFKVKPK